MNSASDINAEAGLLDYAHAGLILLAFAAFAVDQVVHYPVALMALFGIVRVLAAPRNVAAPAVRPLLVVFALIWLPMLVSLLDPVNPAHAKKTVYLYLHFLPAAYYVLCSCTRPHVYRMVVSGVALLILFAGFDAFAQLIWRTDLFGFPYDGRILNGLFGEKQRLGLFLGVLAPLYLDAIRRWCARFPPMWIVLIPLMIVIMMSLKRSGWIMLVIGVGVYLLLRQRRTSAGALAPLLLKLALIGGVVVVTGIFNPVVRHHLSYSAGLFSGDVAAIDQASGYRVTLWQVGARMLRANPVTGIGPRGFRSAYEDYAAADDFWIERGTRGQTHPHLMLLEIAVETGVLGLLGFILAYAVIVRLIVHARDGPAGSVCLLCVAVAWLPFNTHLAFYGSYWSTLAWLLLAVGLAGLRPRAIAAAAD